MPTPRPIIVASVGATSGTSTTWPNSEMMLSPVARPKMATPIGSAIAVTVPNTSTRIAIAFGSLWATVLPLFTAVLALGCGISLIGLLAHAIKIATFAPLLATLIGLGVGIDYSLFVVTRHRNAIKAGREPEAACVRALNTSGRAVLFAGGTVIVALLGLFVLGISFLNGVAVASAIVVLITVIAAVTLIPALLGIIGMRVLSKKERRPI